MVKPGYPACDAKLQGCHGQVHGRRKPPLSLRPVVVVKDDSEGIQAEKACAFRRQNAHAEREREREREKERERAEGNNLCLRHGSGFLRTWKHHELV